MVVCSSLARTVDVHPHGLFLLSGRHPEGVSDLRSGDAGRHPEGVSDLRSGDAGPEVLPLWAGAMHYWRHAPEHWAPCLDAMRAMGLRVVDTYVPWGVHETAHGTFDFGES